MSVGEAAQPAWVCLSTHAGVSSVTVAVGVLRAWVAVVAAEATGGSASCLPRALQVRSGKPSTCKKQHVRVLVGPGGIPVTAAQQTPLLCRCWAWSLEGTRGLCLERTRQDGMRVSHAPCCNVAAGPVPDLGPLQLPTLAPRTRLV